MQRRLHGCSLDLADESEDREAALGAPWASACSMSWHLNGVCIYLQAWASVASSFGGGPEAEQLRATVEAPQGELLQTNQNYADEVRK